MKFCGSQRKEKGSPSSGAPNRTPALGELTDRREQQRSHRHRKTRSPCQGRGGQSQAVLWGGAPCVGAAIREASLGEEGRICRGGQRPHTAAWAAGKGSPSSQNGLSLASPPAPPEVSPGSAEHGRAEGGFSGSSGPAHLHTHTFGSPSLLEGGLCIRYAWVPIPALPRAQCQPAPPGGFVSLSVRWE